MTTAEEYHRLHQQVAEERELRKQKERERDHLLQLAYDVYDSLPAIEEGGPCPVCWTYTHKAWCYYKRLKKAVEEME